MSQYFPICKTLPPTHFFPSLLFNYPKSSFILCRSAMMMIIKLHESDYGLPV